MGCGSSAVDQKAVIANNQIEKDIREQELQAKKIIKLLLLGAAESGKSTIAKQLKIIHMEGFTKNDIEKAKPIIYSNIVHTFIQILQNMRPLKLEFNSEQRQADANQLFDIIGKMKDTDPYPPSVLKSMNALLADGGFQTTIKRGHEYHLHDSAEYFLKSLDRIGNDNYEPTEQDILRSRLRTTGVNQIEFEFKMLNFQVIDVGGQRSERRKWIHVFDSVTAIIFCVSLSCYDMTVYEDGNTNSMHESLKLFDWIVNNEFFKETSIILFLNKKDLFEEKIKSVSLTVCFPEYDGTKSYEDTSLFIQKQFIDRKQSSQKEIYCHLTCATDTQNISVVFDAVTDIVISNNLRNCGLL
ncbi:Guanine nucleotide-binding protein G(o) subunit alpha [Trichoplax sp. H2]|nr:Guanine nucleotide-binding protein G(o) subunit alpha [Trichoplax sp. H2]|eukprot:RDD46908.1 Guanine nucleotide-binding protein G(o) subunit alpha [Trichoplax sp. H2]